VPSPPPRYLRIERSLLFHLWIGVFPATGLSQMNLTMSEKPSQCNHPSSNLNGRLRCRISVPVVNRIGAWSYKALIRGRARTKTRGNLSSQSESMSNRSNFSYVGSGRLLAQVNCLPTIVTSLKSKLSMTSLNKKLIVVETSLALLMRVSKQIKIPSYNDRVRVFFR
jgi:hypothetical protein